MNGRLFLGSIGACALLSVGMIGCGGGSGSNPSAGLATAPTQHAAAAALTGPALMDNYTMTISDADVDHMVVMVPSHDAKVRRLQAKQPGSVEILIEAEGPSLSDMQSYLASSKSTPVYHEYSVQVGNGSSTYLCHRTFDGTQVVGVTGVCITRVTVTASAAMQKRIEIKRAGASPKIRPYVIAR